MDGLRKKHRHLAPKGANHTPVRLRGVYKHLERRYKPQIRENWCFFGPPRALAGPPAGRHSRGIRPAMKGTETMSKFGPGIPDDGIFRSILIVLAISTVAGVVLGLAAESVFHSEALGRAAAGLAVVSAVLYFFFRFLGWRETRRRARENSGVEPPSPDSDR